MDPLLANQQVADHEQQIATPPAPSTSGRINNNLFSFRAAFYRLSWFVKLLRIISIASMLLAASLAAMAFYNEQNVLNGTLAAFGLFAVIKEIADQIDVIMEQEGVHPSLP